ncbi:hypothetical protein HYH03_006179 [Edaphochlamys debaryana]|uniref:Protein DETOXIFICATION n=1 Tax=Edaphochlamys debaryana TaxID=47281 RepID=A0A836C1I9_9CHLO|nr:hypothetical protein HYH03_006179 [Edaphochlamys debaryana]|eukprot:KAG2495579.1 hypothetical protein HYH03_006179 [Edaphochlamys debaryana]
MTLSPRCADERSGASFSFRGGHPPALDEPLLEPSDVVESGRGPVAVEVRKLWRLAGPLILQNVAGYFLSVVSAAFVGHLNDPVALSSAVLAGSFYNITGSSIVIGLSAGMETLCGQAYGARNYKALGIVLQRALLICWVACVPISLAWVTQTSRMLTFLHQNPAIVAGASRYISMVTPALWLSVISACLFRYLVSQQEMRPSTICTIITSALCPLYNWLLIYKYRMGLDGAALAFVASTGTNSVLLLIYTVARDILRARRRSATHTWGGFSWRAWQGWGLYLRYALPSAAMICMEWWIFELVIFLAGSLGDFAEVAVAVMGLSFHITSWTYMVPMSLGTVANTRVSNCLGAGSAPAARLAARVALVTGGCIQLCIALLLFSGRHVVARAFTHQEDIVANVARVMPVIAFSAMGDGLVAVMGGILRGSGRQSLGALLNLCSYWMIGCPVAMFLGFNMKWDVFGFWCGLASATSLQSMVLLLVLSRFDWPNEVRRAAKLVAENASTVDGDLGPGPGLGLDGPPVGPVARAAAAAAAEEAAAAGGVVAHVNGHGGHGGHGGGKGGLVPNGTRADGAGVAEEDVEAAGAARGAANGSHAAGGDLREPLLPGRG